jgi:hypothetical protein
METPPLTEIQPMNLPLSIPVHPWLFDHRFEGTAILPAVEMQQHMACAVQSHFPKAPVTSMQHASFDRFVRIEPACTVIDARCNLIMEENGGIRATFTTAAKVGKGSVTRIKEHAIVCFAASPPIVTEPPASVLNAFHIPGFEIPARRLYAELVPFGPAFQSVQDRVTLTESAATARVCALDHPGATGPLGSPFPLDGSLHAACAWAQRYCGMVAFPVGFDERVIVQPIAPGETVSCTAIPISVHEKIVRFDIWLCDQAGGLREMVKGFAMKDVSGGRMTPPSWVRSESPLWLA